MPFSRSRSSSLKDTLPCESLSELSSEKSGFTRAYLLFPPKEVTAISMQEWLTIGFCATLPFKLSFAYLFLIPALLFFWFNAYQGIVSIKREWLSLHYRFLFFIIYAGIVACTGFNPLKSLQSLCTLSLLSTTCFLIAWYVQRYGFISLLVPFLGLQAMGSINTLLTYGSHGSIPRIFLGDLTQAGQLAIGSVLGFSCFLDLMIASSKAIKAKFFVLPLFTFVIGILLAFFSKFSLFPFFLIIFALIVISQLWLIIGNSSTHQRLITLLALLLPLIALGLIVNLKRGPWLGTWAGITLILMIRRPRFLPNYLALTGIAVLFLHPISNRLGTTIEHFFIPGGRSVIWFIGWNLIQQFPLGIGWKNSPILREFSYLIPPELTHFHNNLINLTVETGVLGAALYLWWISSVCRSAIHKNIIVDDSKDQTTCSEIGKSLSCGILRKDRYAWLGVIPPLLAWQIAGLFEYNIGDKEVILAVYIVIGIAYALTNSDDRPQLVDSNVPRNS
jgi:O-antigen ligase